MNPVFHLRQGIDLLGSISACGIRPLPHGHFIYATITGAALGAGITCEKCKATDTYRNKLLEEELTR